jgi:hypothetical protein
MKIKQSRLGHITTMLYIRKVAGITPSDIATYRKEIREAYGSLSGVKIVILREGLTLSPYGDAYLPPYTLETA